MFTKVLKFVLVSAVIVTAIQYLVSGITGYRIDAAIIIVLLLLILTLRLFKKWLPSVFGISKKLFLWIAKRIGGWLWQKPERKGGAAARPARIRWRE